MRHSLLILLLCCSGVLARDPFRPVAGSVCEASVEPLTDWRLQGIIGREAHFHAWLLTPQGERYGPHRQAISIRTLATGGYDPPQPLLSGA